MQTLRLPENMITFGNVPMMSRDPTGFATYHPLQERGVAHGAPFRILPKRGVDAQARLPFELHK